MSGQGVADQQAQQTEEEELPSALRKGPAHRKHGWLRNLLASGRSTQLVQQPLPTWAQAFTHTRFLFNQLSFTQAHLPLQRAESEFKFDLETVPKTSLCKLNVFPEGCQSCAKKYNHKTQKQPHIFQNQECPSHRAIRGNPGTGVSWGEQTVSRVQGGWAARVCKVEDRELEGRAPWASAEYRD